MSMILAPEEIRIRTMPINLSIKNAPEHVVDRLKKRAAANHRSLQGELMAIIEAASREPMEGPASERKYLTAKELGAKIRALGISSPSSSAAFVRADRDRDS